MGKEIDKIEILGKKANTEPWRWAESLNREHCIREDTEIIIVGTLTPHDYKYFYTSPYNLIYGYIDEARKTRNCLTNCKKELNSPNKTKTEQQIIDEIKKELQRQKIGFLDIIQYAIRKKDTAADSDIEFYNLDYEIFNKVFNETLSGKSVKVICNSRFAEKGYNLIKNRYNSLPDKYEYISQARRWQTKYKKKWIDNL